MKDARNFSRIWTKHINCSKRLSPNPALNSISKTPQTGEYWFASRALELGLVDHLATSDDVIAEAASAGGVYRVYANRKRSFGERLAQPLTRALAAYRP